MLIILQPHYKYTTFTIRVFTNWTKLVIMPILTSEPLLQRLLLLLVKNCYPQCSKAGKAQLVAASQKWGCGGGSKGIRLEDLSASGGAKQKKQSNQPDSSNNCFPQYEDTFEDSNDSNESFDGPFSGPSSSAMASSTTGATSQTSKCQARSVSFRSPCLGT